MAKREHVEAAVNQELTSDQHDKQKSVLSDRTRGMIVGALGTLSLVGLVLTIVQQQQQQDELKAKQKAKKPKQDDQGGADADVAASFAAPFDASADSEVETGMDAVASATEGSPDVNGDRTSAADDTSTADDASAADDDGEGVKVEDVLKDVGTVGTAARGLTALEPVAEALAAFI